MSNQLSPEIKNNLWPRSSFTDYELIKYLIEEEYLIKSKSISLGNPTSNVILEITHLVLGNLVRTYNIKETYVDEYDIFMGILAATNFENSSTVNILECYTQVQLIFVCDMIFPIKNKLDWEWIHHKN